MRGWMLVVAGLVVGAAAVAGVALTRTPGDRALPGVAGSPDPVPAAERFLDEYVDNDGRVVRHDQGGDTVSEGQAYALMLALAVDDEERFRQVWSWTAGNLQRDDGLFAWRWADGEVADESPAADADVDIAGALFVASEQFESPELADEARRVARAVMESETVEVGGRRLLVAGPWAVQERVVNPSYLARCGYEDLAERMDDPRWTELGDGSLALLGELVDDGLPPDWVVVDGDGRATAVAAPQDRQGEGRYGPDAARIAARLALCPDGADVAAALWERLGGLEGDGAGLVYSLSGERIDPAEHPVGLVGAAGAALAAGERDRAEQLVAEAEDLERRHPTYYGAAWVGLGRTMLAGGGEATSQPVLQLVTARQETTTTTTGTTPTTTGTTSTTAPTTTSLPESTTSTGAATTTVTEPGEDGTTSSPPTSSRSSSTVPAGGVPPAPGAGDDGEGGGEDGQRSSDGDLSRGTSGDVLTRAAGGSGADADEPARRRTGAIATAGLVGAAVLGAVLGLRERAVALSRSD